MKKDNRPDTTGQSFLGRMLGGFRNRYVAGNASHGNDPSQLELATALIKIIRRQTSYIKKEIDDWITAIDAARSLQNPRRDLLAELYESVERDNHLTSAMEKRKLRVLGQRFKVIDKKSRKEDPDKTELFASPWFREFMDMVLDSRFHGFSLISFDPPGPMGFSGVEIVPRAHVVPERGVVLPDLASMEGVSYTEPPLSNWVIPVGRRDNLGLLCKAAPEVIWKKGARSAWSEFSQVFGMPLRLARTTITDQKLLDNIEAALVEMGTAAYAILPEGTEIDFKESSRTDAYMIYDKLTERCNSEMSKLIEGQTMTSDSGSSRSQSETHERTADLYMQDDMMFLEVVVNWHLKPFMRMHGLPISDDDLFQFDLSKDLPLTERMTIDKWLNENFEIDPSYFRDTYNVPITAAKQPLHHSTGAPLSTRPVNEAMMVMVADLMASGKHEMAAKVIAEFGKEGNPGKKPEAASRLTELELAAVIEGGHFHAALPGWLSTRLLSMIERVARLVHGGKLPREALDVEMHLEIGSALDDAADEPWKGSEAWNSPDMVMRDRLRHNLFVFSGAKTHAEALALRDRLLDEEGKVKPWAKFRDEVLQVHQEYNVNHLRAEYNHAIMSSRAASQWLEIERDEEIFPSLQFQTAGDDHVRETHARMDGITRPVKDIFWDTYFPPLDWQCRCDAIQVDAGAELTDPSEATSLASESIRHPMFAVNPGKTGVAFNESHPYFRTTSGDMNAMNGVTNYGLRPASRIYADPARLPARPRPVATADEMRKWWDGMKDKGDFVMVDHQGRAFILDDQLLDRAMADEDMWSSASGLLEAVKQPDEIYSVRSGENVRTVIVKYYSDRVMVVEIDNDGKRLRMSDWRTMPPRSGDIDQARSGVLLYRKP